MKPGSNLFKDNIKLSIEFTIKITNDIVDKLIKTEETKGALMNMYV